MIVVKQNRFQKEEKQQEKSGYDIDDDDNNKHLQNRKKYPCLFLHEMNEMIL